LIPVHRPGTGSVNQINVGRYTVPRFATANGPEMGRPTPAISVASEKVLDDRGLPIIPGRPSLQMAGRAGTETTRRRAAPGVLDRLPTVGTVAAKKLRTGGPPHAAAAVPGADTPVGPTVGGGGAEDGSMELGGGQVDGAFWSSVVHAVRDGVRAGAAAIRRAVGGAPVKLSVHELFLEADIDLHAETVVCWPPLFLRHPDVTIDGFPRHEDVCQILSKARLVVEPFVDRSVPSVSPGSTPASGVGGLVARVPLLFFSAFPGSGKSHLCLALAQAVEQFRRRDAAIVRAVTDASLQTPLDAATCQWATHLQVLGLTFNNERWNLMSTDLDGLIAHLHLCSLVPLYLRILFFATAPLHDLDRAHAVWTTLLRRFYLCLQSGTLSPNDVKVAVEELLALRRRRDPQAALILVVDELSKATNFCETLYHETAADAFRSECCRLASTVGGCVLLASLDEKLAHAEVKASGRPVQEAVRLRPFPSRGLFERTLQELAAAGLYLNLDGVLERASSDAVRSEDALVARAQSLATIVGEDARFAVFLSLELSRACDGDRLSRFVEAAAASTSVLTARVWQQRDGEFVVAHVILGLSEVRAEQELPSGTETWDSFRKKGFVHARGGSTFVPRLPLYALWGLAGTPPPREKLFSALNNMVTNVNGELVWRAWEKIWAHLELAFAVARGIVFPDEALAFADMYKYRSYLGPGRLVTTLHVSASRYPKRVAVRELPALLRRWRDGDVTLPDAVYELPANMPGIDAVRFVEDDEGRLYIVCYQFKYSDSHSQTGLSWGTSCSIVRKMCAVLGVAASCEALGWERYVPVERVRKYREDLARVCADIDQEDAGGADVGNQQGVGGANSSACAGGVLAAGGGVDGGGAGDAGQFSVGGASSGRPVVGGSTSSSLSILDFAVFVVVAKRPRGGNFLRDCTRSPQPCMENAIVLTREDLLSHAGPFLEAAVEHYTDILNISVIREPGASTPTSK